MFTGKEQGRQALNFQQAGFERAAEEGEQASCDEVHVAVAQARAGMRAGMGALENQAEQTWTSHEVRLLSGMIVSQATRWKTREEVCSLKQRGNFKGILGKVTNICKTVSREFGATCQKFKKKFKSNRFASTEEVENLRHEMSQSFAKGSLIRTSNHRA